MTQCRAMAVSVYRPPDPASAGHAATLSAFRGRSAMQMRMNVARTAEATGRSPTISPSGRVRMNAIRNRMVCDTLVEAGGRDECRTGCEDQRPAPIAKDHFRILEHEEAAVRYIFL